MPRWVLWKIDSGTVAVATSCLLGFMLANWSPIEPWSMFVLLAPFWSISNPNIWGKLLAVQYYEDSPRTLCWNCSGILGIDMLLSLSMCLCDVTVVQSNWTSKKKIVIDCRWHFDNSILWLPFQVKSLYVCEKHVASGIYLHDWSEWLNYYSSVIWLSQSIRWVHIFLCVLGSLYSLLVR